MEVEVKIRLPDRAAYDKVAAALGSSLQAVHEQENHFFDGSNQELSAQRCVLRLRFYNVDKKAVITIKGKMVIENGIGRASEVEEDVDAVLARKYLTEPTALLQDSPLVRSLNEKTGMSALVCRGGFRNKRQVYSWQGETLELDETYFEHGTLYEIECETDQPEQLRDKLEAFLGQQGVQYRYSDTSKFANFVNKTLD